MTLILVELVLNAVTFIGERLGTERKEMHTNKDSKGDLLKSSPVKRVESEYHFNKILKSHI